jgi:hypothetical protein
VYRGIEGIGKGIGGAYELGEAGIDIGRGDFQTAATALGGRVGEAEGLPEIVVTGEVEEVA